MKLRLGFVSNSSSSSFILDKRYMEPGQIAALLAYSGSEQNTDGWSISEEEDFVKGHTTMNNGAIDDFFKELDLRYRAIVTYEEDF